MKLKFFSVACICIICSSFLVGCNTQNVSKDTQQNVGNIKQEETENKQPQRTYTETETIAINYFDLIQQNIEKNKNDADITDVFTKLVELKDQNPNNKMIKNLCNYCYIQYEILLAKKMNSSAGIWDIQSAVSKIEDDYTDYAYEEILQFKNKVKNYTDEDWANYINVEIPQIVKSPNVDKYPNVVADAILQSDNFNRGVIASSKEILERYTFAIISNANGTIKELEDNLQVIWLVNGNKCNIISQEDGLVKIKILTGNFKDKIVWTISENVKKQ